MKCADQISVMHSHYLQTNIIMFVMITCHVLVVGVVKIADCDEMNVSVCVCVQRQSKQQARASVKS